MWFLFLCLGITQATPELVIYEVTQSYASSQLTLIRVKPLLQYLNFSMPDPWPVPTSRWCTNYCREPGAVFREDCRFPYLYDLYAKDWKHWAPRFLNKTYTERHWVKYGTCSGLDRENYFGLGIRIMKRYSGAGLKSLSHQHFVDSTEVQAVLPENAILHCDQGLILKTVQFCLEFETRFHHHSLVPCPMLSSNCQPQIGLL